MKFTYRKVRWALLALLLVSVVLLTIAGFREPGDTLRTILVYIGFAMFLVAVVVMFIGFKCPACGAHFFKNALFMHKCPVCGFEFMDFELGRKAELPEDFAPSEQIKDPLKDHKRWY